MEDSVSSIHAIRRYVRDCEAIYNNGLMAARLYEDVIDMANYLVTYSAAEVSAEHCAKLYSWVSPFLGADVMEQGLSMPRAAAVLQSALSPIPRRAVAYEDLSEDLATRYAHLGADAVDTLRRHQAQQRARLAEASATFTDEYLAWDSIETATVVAQPTQEEF
jgi:uncharacterized protein YbbK (DUF523 family)